LVGVGWCLRSGKRRVFIPGKGNVVFLVQNKKNGVRGEKNKAPGGLVGGGGPQGTGGGGTFLGLKLKKKKTLETLKKLQKPVGG